MFVTISSLTEFLRAKIARKRFLTCMDSLVILQGICPVESLSALLTAIPAFTTMDKTMLVVDRAREEAFATYETVIWTFACMALSDVIIEIWTDSKAPGTSFLSTLKRLHATMETQMLPEMRGLSVGFPADIAEILTTLRQDFFLGLPEMLLLVVMHQFIGSGEIKTTAFTKNHQGTNIMAQSRE